MSRLGVVSCLILITAVLGSLYGVDSVDSSEQNNQRQVGFDHLTVQDGLSNSSVSGIYQDKDGFVWLGTQSGLNRYDGYAFEYFHNDPFDRNSLSHNLIQTMYYEESGVIWLGTYGGLNRFDPERGLFTRYEHDPESRTSLSDNVVVAITRDSDEQLWVGTLDGLNRLDPEGEGFTRYTADGSPGALPDEVVRSLAVDAGGTLWIGTYGGLSKYLPGEDRFETITAEDGVLPSNFVMSILPDPDREHLLWIGSWDGGVTRYNSETGEAESFVLAHNEIYTMLFDRQGTLWVGTWGNGLFLLDPETGESRHVVSDDGRPGRRLSHDIVYTLMEDESGIVWVGTNGGGVSLYVPWENRFATFVSDPDDPNTIAPGRVESIHIDDDGTAWFGIYHGGVSRYDPETGEIRRYRRESGNPRSLSNDIVNEVVRDSRGILWVGTNEGLNRYIPEEDSFVRTVTIPEQREDVVFEIEEAPDGRLWLGTHTAGVTVFDPETGSAERYTNDPDDPASLSDDLVRSILHDSTGTTWVGTNQGLNRYVPGTDSFVRYRHDVDREGTLSSDNVRSLFEDSSGKLWVATGGGGVNFYDRTTDSFDFLSTNDGLTSNVVHNVAEAAGGILYFATNRGLTVYDPVDESMRIFDSSAGLLSNELTQAVARGPEGELYFGSSQGVTVLEGADTGDAEYTPPILLTEVAVLGEPRPLQLEEEGRYEPLELYYGDSLVSFEFSVLDYATPDQNIYAYRLEGFEEEWVQGGTRNFRSYTNLSPGEYTLRIRGAGSRGNWNRTGVAVPLVVHPPWWSTNAARALYVVAAALLGFYVFYRVRRRSILAEAQLQEQERINRELDRKVRERTAQIEAAKAAAERANHEKSQFLANMSHEIRTPLNGMIGMLSLLSRTPLEPVQKEYLRQSTVSAESLNVLVNDLLDFERIEAGELRLLQDPFSLTAVGEYIANLFTKGAADKNLRYTVDLHIDPDCDTVLGDRGRVVQIVTNLVGNAIKYTRSGEVRVEIAAKGEEEEHQEGCGGVRITVSDTGSGIPQEEQARIFDRFRQLDNGYTKANRGVGLGLSIVREVVTAMNGSLELESSVGEGSTFEVRLPLPHLRPAAEERGRTELASRGVGVEAHPLSDRGSSESDTDHTTRPILVCEDEAINRLYLQERLKELGYPVDIAKDGREAVQKATAQRYAVVLMDVGMPKLSGLDATAEIRTWEQAHRPEYNVPIVALTAHTYEEDIENCRKAGMNDFVAKPIRERELSEALDRWVGGEEQ